MGVCPPQKCLNLLQNYPLKAIPSPVSEVSEEMDPLELSRDNDSSCKIAASRNSNQYLSWSKSEIHGGKQVTTI